MSTDTKLLAAQAANKRLREALDRIYMLPSYKEHHVIAVEALTTPDDTAELDALIQQRDELLAENVRLKRQYQQATGREPYVPDIDIDDGC